MTVTLSYSLISKFYDAVVSLNDVVRLMSLFSLLEQTFFEAEPLFDCELF